VSGQAGYIWSVVANNPGPQSVHVRQHHVLTLYKCTNYVLVCLFLQALLMLMSRTLSRTPPVNQTAPLSKPLLQPQAAAAAATAQAASLTMLLTA
jgi:hypothetical protein